MRRPAIGETVRFVGGQDEYEVIGHAKTQPKAMIEINGEVVYVPYSCLELPPTKEQVKLDYAVRQIEKISKEAGLMSRVGGKLKDLLRTLENWA